MLGGHDDWRAPRIDELETIIFDPPSVTPWNVYWSSSTDASGPGYAWLVYFQDGRVGCASKTDNGYVRCVRGGPFWPFDPSLDFQTPVGKPDIVLDTYWDYMWQKGDSGETPLNWDEANAYCAGLELDGYSDWRLPEIEALETIVNYTTYDPALSMNFDPRRSDFYWSRRTTPYGPDSAWSVHFHNGHASYMLKTYGGYVRCVRGGRW